MFICRNVEKEKGRKVEKEKNQKCRKVETQNCQYVNSIKFKRKNVEKAIRAIREI